MSNYRSDKVRADVVVRFTTVGLLASIFGVTAPMAVILIAWNITGCGYVGYRMAILLTMPIQLLAWALITIGMMATFDAYTRPTPPAAATKKSHISRSVGGSVRGKRGRFDFRED